MRRAGRRAGPSARRCGRSPRCLRESGRGLARAGPAPGGGGLRTEGRLAERPGTGRRPRHGFLRRSGRPGRRARERGRPAGDLRAAAVAAKRGRSIDMRRKRARRNGRPNGCEHGEIRPGCQSDGGPSARRGVAHRIGHRQRGRPQGERAERHPAADRDRQEAQGAPAVHPRRIGPSSGKSWCVLSHTGAAPRSIATYRVNARGAATSATTLPMKNRGTDQHASHPS